MSNVVLTGAICEIHDGLFSASVNYFRRTQREIAVEHTTHRPRPNHLGDRRRTRLRRFLARRSQPSTFEGAAVGILDPENYRDRTIAVPDRIEIKVSEFVDLDDGKRVLLRDDRGWSCHCDDLLQLTASDLEGETLSRYGRDGVDPNDADWIIDRLGTFGVDVDSKSVSSAPYVVEFGPFVIRMLQERPPPGVPIRR